MLNEDNPRLLSLILEFPGFITFIIGLLCVFLANKDGPASVEISYKLMCCLTAMKRNKCPT